jgi:hypothetical protein
MSGLRLFLTMRHETFRHIIGNIRDRMKLKNSVVASYLTAIWTICDKCGKQSGTDFWKAMPFILVKE